MNSKRIGTAEFFAHVYGDGHTLGVTDQCDGPTYMGLTNRAGSEPIDDTKIN